MPMGASRMSDQVSQHTLEDGKNRDSQKSFKPSVLNLKQVWAMSVEQMSSAHQQHTDASKHSQVRCFSSGHGSHSLLPPSSSPQCLWEPQSSVSPATAQQTSRWTGSRCRPRWAAAGCLRTGCPIELLQTAQSPLWRYLRTAPSICWRDCSLTPSTSCAWLQPPAWAGVSLQRGLHTVHPRPPAATVHLQCRERITNLHIILINANLNVLGTFFA